MKNRKLHFSGQKISRIEIILAILLLIREIYQFFTLRSIYGPFNGLIREFEKYKENTYSPIFMWIIILITGILGLKVKKRFWIWNQISLLMIFLSMIFPLIYIYFSGWRIPVLIILIILIGLLIYIQILMNNKNLIDKYAIGLKDKIFAVSVGAIFAIIYWLIKIFFEME